MTQQQLYEIHQLSLTYTTRKQYNTVVLLLMGEIRRLQEIVDADDSSDDTPPPPRTREQIAADYDEMRRQLRATVNEDMAQLKKRISMRNTPTPAKPASRFAWIVDKFKSMTSGDFRTSLGRAGIIDGDGKLTEKYRKGGES